MFPATRLYFFIIAVLSLLLFPQMSMAGNPLHGARAAAMATAFTGVADDPSAIMHNPAGLVLLKGTNIYSGGSAMIISTSHKSPSGQSQDAEFQTFYIPHLYISSDMGKEGLAFGLGIHSPFGLGGRKWAKDGLTRYSSVESYTATFAINPTLAIEVMPGFSVAAGVDYMRAMSYMEMMIDQSSLGAGDAKITTDTEGDGWGYNLGALITLSKDLRLGLAYRSGIRIDYKGDLKVDGIAPALQPLIGSHNFKTNATSTSTFPESFNIGIAYFPNDKLTLAFDVELAKWSSFRKSDLNLENEVPAAGLTDITTQFDWHDSWHYMAGVEYRLNDSVSLRMGYVYVNTPAPEHTITPGMPDSDQHNLTFGAGYVSGKWTADFYYNPGYNEDRTVNNSILSGEYETFVHTGGFSIGYAF